MEKLLPILKDYFSTQDDVEMAFLFGSTAKGTETINSDVDIAVYFKPKSGKTECESESFYEQENETWNDVEKIVKRKVDFVVLNRAPAILASSIIKNGEAVFIKNRFRYLDFMLKISSLAIDFREFIRDFRAIKARSHSLSLEDKDRLIKLVDFLESELKDTEKYQGLDFRTYETDREKRRSVELNCQQVVFLNKKESE